MPFDPTEHKLAAILSADVVGYSRLMAEDEAATVRTLTAYHGELSLLVGQHRGRVVDSPGDNLLAEFPSALDACRCAVETQRVIEARNADLPENRKMQFRIGIHLGDVMVEGERIFGDGINIAARLEGLAEAGGICISGTVHDQIRNKLDLVYEDLGEQRVKNIPDPMRVYRMRPAPTARAAVKPKTGWGRPTMAAGVALVVVAAAWVALRVLTPGGTPLPPVGSIGPIRSIAVLPLENLSGDPEQEYFTDGMTEALIAELGKLGTFRVISRTSVMRFKRAQLPIRQIAALLNVEGIVEGSVLRADDRVRITAQLIDARRDSHLWAESYERKLSDILALQGEVARAIAGKIDLELTPHEAQLATAHPVNPKAQEAYLKGRHFAWQHTATGSQKAVEYLQEAIRLDPEWALAYSGLADTLSCAPTHAWNNIDSPNWPSNPREVMAMAEVNASKAIELDDRLAEAHNSMGLVKMFGHWNWAGAEQDIQRAIDLDPSYFWPHHVYGLLLALTGRLDQALVEMQRTVELDPLSVMAIVALGDLHAWRGEDDQAIAQWEKAMELDPSYPMLHQSLAGSFCRGGRRDLALGALERARVASGDDPLIVADLAYCYATSGREGRARELLRELQERSTVSYISPMNFALVHTGLGEHDEALEWLERAYEVHAFLLPLVVVEPSFDPLRSDPRFRDLTRRIGLPVEREGVESARAL